MTDPLETRTVNRPEPVLDGAKLVAAVTGILGTLGTVAVLLGLLTLEEVGTWTAVVVSFVTGAVTLVGVVSPLIKARQTRELVTPLADPVDSSGVPLAPVGGPEPVGG